MEQATALLDRERRKQLKLRARSDLDITPTPYQGRTYYVVKDPASLQYWRFREQEYFIFQLMDGETTLEDAQKRYEERFRPERITLDELEGFYQQVMTGGLAHIDSIHLGEQLLERRGKRKRREWLQYFTNILAIRIPVFDPDWLLTRMLRPMRWIFTFTFLFVSCAVFASALFLVLTHFETFRSKLPDYHDFFSPKNLLTMWITLGLVKIIHEFGHGLSCKAFGGECHEMGLLLLCFSPCLYCNVSDAWVLPQKWKRILISSAGIYVELMIAALATFIWWNTHEGEVTHRLALSLMVVCSVSTVIFNGNPLLRYDGYFVMSDWLEIPNLSQRSNRFLLKLAQEFCLGMEVQPEPYMDTRRKILFVTYAIVSYVYRWVVTFSILWFFYQFLKPYKLQSVGTILAIAAAGSMAGWPIYRMFEAWHKRGRIPDMKRPRVIATCVVATLLILGFFLVPLPVARVRQTGLVQVHPDAIDKVYVPVPGGGNERVPGILTKIYVHDGQQVERGRDLGEFHNMDLEMDLLEAKVQAKLEFAKMRAAQVLLHSTKDEAEKGKYRSEIARAKGENDRLNEKVNEYMRMRDQLVLKAPRSGIVTSPPRVDEAGRQWERDRTTPFCSIVEPGRLRVLVPVSPSDHQLLKDDLEAAKAEKQDLNVDIRIQGRGGMTWKGRIAELPQSDAKELPLALSTQAGGPVAAKPAAGNSTTATPQTQQYLVAVDILDPDDAICPGTLGQVKIHCRWHSGAWWLWRTLASTFDIKLL